MARPLVVLADPDYTYLAPMELKFLEELGDKIRLEVFTDAASWQEYLEAPHDIEALLVCEQWFGEGVARQNVANSFVLTEEKESDRTSNLAVDYTFKYSSLSLIFGKVVSSSPRLRSNESTGQAKVLLFFSPVGGSGKTTAALAVAACLRAMYKRVLYVDAEYVQTFLSFVKGGRVAPPQMAQEMQRMSGDAYDLVRESIESDCIDYLPPLRTGLTAFGIDFSFYLRFIESAKLSGDYDYVVVDTDSSLTAEKVQLLGMADRVTVMVTQDLASRHKVACFLANIDRVDDDKYSFICNDYRSKEPNAFASSGGSQIELDGFVEHDESLAGMDVMLLGDVAAFKRLAHSLE